MKTEEEVKKELRETEIEFSEKRDMMSDWDTEWYEGYLKALRRILELEK